MRYLLVILPLMGLVGCGATIINTRDGIQSTYAPSNEIEKKGGTIKYYNQAAEWILKRNREDAYRKMHQYCGGAYKITKEEEKTDGGSSFSTSSYSATYSSDRWVYIDFECEN